MLNTTDKNPLFHYYPPKNKYIGLISIPHSGTDKPVEFNSYLVDNEISLKQDVDFFVHKLVDIPSLQNAGVAILKSNIIRTCVDLNRPPETCVLNWKKNSQGHKVVENEPHEEQRILLRQNFYSPYFEMLKALIHELMAKQSTANIIDLHSMPSKATAYHLKQKPGQPIDRPDFCISDQFGATCSAEFIEYIKAELSKSYKKVFINDPYKGGHITEYIHQTFPDVNNIQIEIKRELYMDESSFKLLDNHNELKKNLTAAIIRLFNHFED